LLPLFANDTGGKFATGVVDTGGNLPQASLTPVAKIFGYSVIDPLLENINKRSSYYSAKRR
jgi:hypothetical protein